MSRAPASSEAPSAGDTPTPAVPGGAPTRDTTGGASVPEEVPPASSPTSEKAPPASPADAAADEAPLESGFNILWLLGPRRTFGDEQVWPPVPRSTGEPPGPSTQPFPAVPGEPAPVGGAGEPTETVPETAPETDARTPRETVTAPATSVPPPRRRTALWTGILVPTVTLAMALAAVVAIGLPAWNGSPPAPRAVPDRQVHTVTSGGTAVLMNIAWKVGVEQADVLPDARPAAPGRQWLKITVTRTSLNPEGVALRARPGIEVRHPDGRTWQAEILKDGLPAEVGKHRIGVGYAYEAVSEVPRTVAGQVEVRITPSPRRMPLEDEPATKAFERAEPADPAPPGPDPQGEVLLFKR